MTDDQIMALYLCPICRHQFDNRDDAVGCYLQGYPTFYLKEGDPIWFVFTVGERRVYRDRNGYHAAGGLKVRKNGRGGKYYERAWINGLPPEQRPTVPVPFPA